MFNFYGIFASCQGIFEARKVVRPWPVRPDRLLLIPQDLPVKIDTDKRRLTRINVLVSGLFLAMLFQIRLYVSVNAAGTDISILITSLKLALESSLLESITRFVSNLWISDSGLMESAFDNNDLSLRSNYLDVRASVRASVRACVSVCPFVNK